MKRYIREGRVAERPHLNLPQNTYEEELGLDGFFGPVTHLYWNFPPTQWTSIKKSSFQWPTRVEADLDYIKPQCYRPLSQGLVKGDFFSSCRTLFWNSDVAMHLHTVTEDSKTYFRNADASDLIFVHEGSGVLESPFGNLRFKAGDYVLIPKGVTFRLSSTKAYLLRIEDYATYFKKPETGILGQQALYHEENLKTPEFKPVGSEKTSLLRIQKDGILTEVEYGGDLRDVTGWCGTLYPFILPVSQIAPILSSMAHLPPSVNATFVTPQFIVCTFLPRPLEEPEGALKVPFYHSNIDYDEVIFYHAGDFFSRDNMSAGSVTLHPRGINHGPHPKALKAQNKKTRTDEIAVMVDTIKPLKVSTFARELEVTDYWKSWMSA